MPHVDRTSGEIQLLNTSRFSQELSKGILLTKPTGTKKCLVTGLKPRVLPRNTKLFARKPVFSYDSFHRCPYRLLVNISSKHMPSLNFTYHKTLTVPSEMCCQVTLRTVLLAFLVITMRKSEGNCSTFKKYIYM